MAAAAAVEAVKTGATTLRDSSCVPCTTSADSDLAALSSADVAEMRKGISAAWDVVDHALERRFVAKNFQAALDALVAFGAVAEAAGHHPDLHITGFRNVTVRISTHGLHGKLSVNDFILASKLDTVPVVYSPKWARENPTLATGVADA